MYKRQVSGTPGKTRTLNFFNINDELRLVDVPGYGYAKVNDKIKESFGDMIDTYLRERDVLKGLVLIVDYRHKPTRDDMMCIRDRCWSRRYGKKLN